tara:strand:- start:1668 stop:2414 length:747 start_codon:yes stop_codon:yes gene_type:complete
MAKLKAVFWDVDGTIADTEMCGHRVAFNLAFKDFDLNWSWEENQYLDLLKISGGLNRIIYYRNKIKSDISDSQCSKIQTQKRHHYKNLIKSGKIRVREGVLRLIDELSCNNIEQFIVTTSGRDSLEPFLHTSLSTHLRFFTSTITYEDVTNHKPFPDAYKYALQISKQSEVNCIAIEDSIIGVEAAKAANINCLLTLPPWSTSKQNISRKANACVNSLGSICNPSTLIYGKQLKKDYVDLEYLINIII